MVRMNWKDGWYDIWIFVYFSVYLERVFLNGKIVRRVVEVRKYY